MSATLNKKVKILLIILGVIGGILILFNLLLKLIPFKELKDFENQQNSTQFYSKEGELLYVMPLEEGLRREVIPLSQIPLEVQKIFIDTEDGSFYHHPGIDIFAIIRAAFQNKTEGRTVSGASTMTMQLARMVIPRKDFNVTISQKFTECINALRIEAKLSKKRILELYLNNVPFGFQVEGVVSAAKYFYGKDISLLSPEEVEKLAYVPRRPSLYGPKIKQASFKYPDLCPHYVRFFIEQWKVENPETKIPDRVELSINILLNSLIQSELQNQVAIYKNDARLNNGAAVVIENKTGNIIGWIGNVDFEDLENGQVDGVKSLHQAGSSMKPFLYALALEKGFSPDTILADIPMDFGGEQVYVPMNFNNRYNGPVRFRVCLASSLNIPAVNLLYQLGIDQYMSKLYECGFDSLRNTRSSTGLSLALGSNEVTLYELVKAFSVFANDGLVNGNRVYSEDTARLICSILSDRKAQSLGFGNAKVFQTSYPCLFKTGTANQFQDIVALASTNQYTIGVWMGNLNGDTVLRKTGSSIPAEICRNAMDFLMKDQKIEKFPEPKNFTKKKICILSGMAPGKDCTAVGEEYIHNRLLDQQQVCNWHYSENGFSKIKYPSEYQHWASSHNMAGRGYDNFSRQKLSFLYPTDGATFIYDNSLPKDVQILNIMAFGGLIEKAKLKIDGKEIPKDSHRMLWKNPLEKGRHVIEISDGIDKEQRIYFVR